MERVFQNAGQAARFFFLELPGDNGVAAINRIANHRRGLNHAVEHDRKAVPFVLFCDFAELFRPFAIELELHGPAFVAVVSMRFFDAITAEIGFLFDE